MKPEPATTLTEALTDKSLFGATFAADHRFGRGGRSPR